MSERPQAMEAFSWSAHPARQRAGATALALAIIAAVGALVGFETHSIPAAVGAVALLVLTLNRFFFRSTFTINEQGITARYLLRRQSLRWREVRRFMVDRHGGYLSTRAMPSRLDAWRGLHLLFGPDRDDAIHRIRGHIPGIVESPRMAGEVPGVPA